MDGGWSCYRGGQFNGGRMFRGGQFNGGSMVMLQRWLFQWRENGHVRDKVSFLEGG